MDEYFRLWNLNGLLCDKKKTVPVAKDDYVFLISGKEFILLCRNFNDSMSRSAERDVRFNKER